ncbi:MAG: T9SS type A sorting domain-containing protein [Bacteroidia bacterium]
MMKKILLFSTILFSVFTGYTQNLQWVHTYGGKADEIVAEIATDQAGNIYMAGQFQDTVDFDPGVNTNNLISHSTVADAFIVKYDPQGNFIHAFSFGGTGIDVVHSIEVDKSGGLYVSGYFEFTADFDPGPGTAELSATGTQNLYLARYDADGNFVWVRKITGSAFQAESFIDLDESENIYLHGTFTGLADFDANITTDNLTPVGLGDVFVAKYDSSGNFIWSAGIGGTGEEKAVEIISDQSNSLYITGTFSGNADFDPGSGTLSLNAAGSTDAYLAKLDTAGNLVWAKGFGGTDLDRPSGLRQDGNGHLVVCGVFLGTADFDAGAGTSSFTSLGSQDFFIAKYSDNGDFIWANASGGTGLDSPRGIEVDDQSAIYIFGVFTGASDFDPGAGTAVLTAGTGIYGFVAKYDIGGNYVWAGMLGGGTSAFCNSMVVNPNGSFYLSAFYGGVCDVDPGPGTVTVSSNSTFYDIFLAEYTQPLTAIDEQPFTANIEVFPNPSDRAITIKSTEIMREFSVRDMKGKEVFHTYPHIPLYEYQIPTSDFSVGIYFVQILFDNIQTTRKFIVNH